MLVKEMIVNFMVESNTINNDVKPYTDDILYYLNAAQLIVLQQIYMSDNQDINKTKDKLDLIKNLTTSIKLYSDIDPSAEPSTSIKGTTDSYITYNEDTDSTSFILPSNYLYYISNRCKVDGTYKNSNTKKWIISKMVNEYELFKLLATAYNNPIYRNGYSYINNSKLYQIVDSYTNLYNIEVSYIRKPKLLSITTDDSSYTTTCEINTYYHNTIITEAVKLYMSSLITNK